MILERLLSLMVRNVLSRDRSTSGRRENRNPRGKKH